MIAESTCVPMAAPITTRVRRLELHLAQLSIAAMRESGYDDDAIRTLDQPDSWQDRDLERGVLAETGQVISGVRVRQDIRRLLAH